MKKSEISNKGKMEKKNEKLMVTIYNNGDELSLHREWKCKEHAEIEEDEEFYALIFDNEHRYFPETKVIEWLFVEIPSEDKMHRIAEEFADGDGMDGKLYLRKYRLMEDDTYEDDDLTEEELKRARLMLDWDDMKTISVNIKSYWDDDYYDTADDVVDMLTKFDIQESNN